VPDPCHHATDRVDVAKDLAEHAVSGAQPERPMTKCRRCRNEFPDTELRPAPLWLRLLAFPLWLLHSLQVHQELRASYCRVCRRQINVCLFFVAFCTVGVLIAMLVKKLQE
jgi:hypothetical protein